MLVRLLLIVALLSQLQLKDAAAAAQIRIVGGQQAYAAQFPYQVSIRFLNMHKCGGVILSRNYILTAARCVVENISSGATTTYSPHLLNIRAGSVSLYDNGMLAQISQIKIHEDYGNSLLNDLALLQLTQPLIYSDSIKPINLSVVRPSLSSNVAIIGWAFETVHGEYISRFLQWSSEATVVQPENCFSNILGAEANEKIICLQSPQDIGICTADIGGAAVWENELIGLASFSLERCASEFPDGFTSIAYYRQWIRNNSDVK